MLTLDIRPYQRRDRDDLLNLTFYSRHTHTHLDWVKPVVWLDGDESLVRLAWQDERLVGFIGATQPFHQTSWIRMLGIANDADLEQVLQALWHAICLELRAQGVRQIAVLVVNRWLVRYLPQLGFHYLEDIITLQRYGTAAPPPRPTRVAIRPAYLEDLPTLTHIDHSAFQPPWQMTRHEIRQAQRISASCTLALLDGEPVGYQLSTRHHSSGHLARLGVLPGHQGQGIGGRLLHHLIDRFSHRGVTSITVNTQLSNVHSQHLYQRYYFQRNGFDLPVWVKSTQSDESEV